MKTVLSDNGREFCGRPDRHPYELFLQLEDIEHRTTKVGRPQSNGFIERFHRTLLDEHLRVKGRTTWYETVDEMQQDLEAYLETYNRKRPHRGRAMEGRTPYQVFKAGLTDARKAAKARRRRLRRRQPRHSSGEGQLSGHYHLCTQRLLGEERKHKHLTVHRFGVGPRLHPSCRSSCSTRVTLRAKTHRVKALERRCPPSNDAN